MGHHDPATPVTVDPQVLKTAQETWADFTKMTTITVIAVMAILGLMAIFLV